MALPLKDWWYFTRRNMDRAIQLREIADEYALAELEPAKARLEVSRSAGEAPVVEEGAKALLEVPVPAPPGMIYKPYQRAGIAFMLAAERGTLLADEPGLGKAQPLDAKILTPTGWTTMGAIEAGDRVIGANGKACRVTGVFPQGEKQIYRVTFTDGSSTECCDDHLWQVNASLRKWQGLKPRVLPLSKIRERLHDGWKNRHFIPLVAPIEFDAPMESLLIDPYLLGVLLGDGGIAHSVTFSTADEEIVEAVRASLPCGHEVGSKSGAYDYRIRRADGSRDKGDNAVRNALRDLGLFGKKSERKYVPERYKLGSVETRLAVLQGLLDTDGYVMPGTPTIEFCTVSRQLADDVQFLVESLGGTSSVKLKGERTYTNARGEERPCQLAYRIRVSLPAPLEPFRLSRKKGAHVQRTKYQPSRSIAHVEWVGRKEARCISVDADDHLYVTDRFIVTHNTIQVLGLINAGKPQRALIVVPASLRLNWLRETILWMVRPTRIHVVGEEAIIKGVLKSPMLVRSKMHKITAGPHLPQDVCEAGVDAYRDEIVIVNYDRVRDPDVMRELMGCYWDLLACDEGHYLKNPKAQRTVACLGAEEKGVLVTKGLRHQSGKIVAMTGTPLPSRPVEMWPLLHAVAPNHFPAFFPYARRYCNAHKVFISPRVGEKWDFGGASNLGELQEVMRSTCMVRRLKAEVLHDLPPKIRQILPLPREDYAGLLGDDDDDEDYDDDGEPGSRRRRVVEEIEEAFALPEVAAASTPEEAYANAAAKLGKAAKLSFTRMSKMREKLALAKLPAVLEICDNRLEETDKIIIFAHHHSVIEKILDHYNPKPKKQKSGKTTVYPQEAVAVYGPVKAAERDLAVTTFQEDKTVRVFVGSIAAAGVGLTLTAASTVIFAEVDWVPGNIVQAEDRAHRIGQTDTVNVLHVVVEQSLDARMIQLLVAKADVADRALDKRVQLTIPEAGIDWQAEKIRKREEQAKLYPPVTPLLRELVQLAMQHLADSDPDRATKVNGVGFNKFDNAVGHSLAGAPDPTPAQIWRIGVNFARKYKGQLGNIADRIADEAARIQEEQAPTTADIAFRERAIQAALPGVTEAAMATIGSDEAMRAATTRAGIEAMTKMLGSLMYTLEKAEDEGDIGAQEIAWAEIARAQAALGALRKIEERHVAGEREENPARGRNRPRFTAAQRSLLRMLADVPEGERVALHGADLRTARALVEPHELVWLGRDHRGGTDAMLTEEGRRVWRRETGWSGSGYVETMLDQLATNRGRGER